MTVRLTRRGRGDQSASVRTLVVPAGIVPVRRTSPLPVAKSTPWRDKPAGELIDRTGGREWFGSHLDLGRERPHSTAYGMSATVHLSLGFGFLLLMLSRHGLPTVAKAGPALMMPVMLLIASPEPPDRHERTELSLTAKAPPPSAADPSTDPAPAVVVEAPTGIRPESLESGGGSAEGTAPASTGSGTDPGTSTNTDTGTPASGPLRIGEGVRAPKRIKYVKPVYPENTLPGQIMGTVFIEVTISPAGKVIEARVLRSIPGLDQAALDAVRQWEYEPSRVDGVAVSIVMPVGVLFEIR